jgi:hypothetical protein
VLPGSYPGPTRERAAAAKSSQPTLYLPYSNHLFSELEAPTQRLAKVGYPAV